MGPPLRPSCTLAGAFADMTPAVLLLVCPCVLAVLRARLTHARCQQTLERIPKMSANWYAEVVKKNRLDMM